MKLSRYITAIVTAVLIIFAGNVIQAQDSPGFKIIVNELNPASSIDKAKARKIFLKMVPKWDNGNAVVPVDQRKDAQVRYSFSQAVHGKSPDNIVLYWQQLLPE